MLSNAMPIVSPRRLLRIALPFLLLLPVPRSAAFSANAPAAGGRIIQVVPLSADAPAGAERGLAKALASSRPGDRLVLAPGVYEENVVIPHNGLIISSPAGTELSMPVEIVGSAGSPTVIDRRDTRWSGIAFVGSTADPAVELEDFSGRFEHCRFSVGNDGPGRVTLDVFGGVAAFHGCVFSGGGGVAAAVGYDVGEPVFDELSADFTYCLFEGFTEGILAVSGDMEVRFANCLFTRNGRLVTRPTQHRREVEVVNSVLYFNDVPEIVDAADDAAPVKLSHCVVTPVFTNRLWLTGEFPEKQEGVVAENVRILSPGFTGAGRRIMVNLCIDDTRNVGVWNALTNLADEHGFKATFAANTAQAKESDWLTMRDGLVRGHEVGSHSRSHVPVVAMSPLSVGFHRPGMKSARLSIDASKILRVIVDSRIILTQPLDAAGMNINTLTRTLARAGVKVKAASYYGGIPARLLSTVENLDIAFNHPGVPLGIDNDEFFEYEVKGSREDLLDHLPEAGEPVFLHPFSVSSPVAKKLLAKAGYKAARSNISVETSGVDADFPDEAVVNIFGFPGYSLNSARSLVPGNPVLDNVRLVLDYAKRFAPMIFLYSHGFDEFSLDDWRGLLAMLAEDPRIEVLTVSGIADRVREMGESADGERYAFAMPAPSLDYRPGPRSPLVGAGRQLGLTKDFAGKTIPPGEAPNIGLYQ